MQKVYALSFLLFRKMIEQNKINDITVSNKDALFICIHNTKYESLLTNSYYTNQPLLQNCDNVLNVWFDDIEHPHKDKYGHTHIGMQPNQAKEIVEFIIRNSNKQLAFVHCAAGVSRSDSVAQFIADLWHIPHHTFIRMNPSISVKSHFTKTLNEALAIYEKDKITGN